MKIGGGERLVFPCGAYFPVKHGDEILDAAHRATDATVRAVPRGARYGTLRILPTGSGRGGQP